MSSLQGEWLCYRPRAFARGRDYQVFSGTPAAPRAQLVDTVTVAAEGMLRTQPGPTEPAWQYLPLGEERSMALCRCAEGELEGARSLVVWALLLPHAYVRSPRFSLSRLPDLFPGPVLDAQLPPALDLARVSLTPSQGPAHGASNELDALISLYLDAGRAVVALDPAAALRAFTSVVEMLPPRDRLEVSFATAPGSARALGVEAAAPALEEVAASAEGLVRLELWRFNRFRLPDAQLQSASLRERSAGWLCSLLRLADLRTSYAGLMNAARTQLTPGLHEVAFGYVRRALEMRLSELSTPEAAQALTALIEDRLLSADAGVPPMWLPRVALQNQCVAQLSPALLERVLQPDVVPMILESVQRPPAAARIANLAHAVEAAPQMRDGQGLHQACAPVIREILEQVAADPRRRALRDDRMLARAFAVLLLHDHAAQAARPAATR